MGQTRTYDQTLDILKDVDDDCLQSKVQETRRGQVRPYSGERDSAGLAFVRMKRPIPCKRGRRPQACTRRW